MAASRPRTLEELLCGLDISRAGGAMHVIERLVEVGEVDDGKFEVSDFLDPYDEDSQDEDDLSDQESEDSCYWSDTEDEEDLECLLPVSSSSEDSAPPASSLSSSTKRSREESDKLQVSAKRQRKTCEDSHEAPRPSTSGLVFSTDRYWRSPFQDYDSDSDDD
ncbi:hypothetical protein ABVT39_025052 [Epinephelus coioides]